MNRSGPDLALLLLAGFRAMVDEAITELAELGHEGARPVHDFAMRAIANGAESASELGRSLSITKQSAARTITILQERGYVTSEPDTRDARRKRLRVTELGFEVLRKGEAVLNARRRQWAEQIGPEQLETLEDQLASLVGDQPIRFDTPGWMARDLGA
jgi:DNA-binding MarR family transcriptional regulator